MQRKNDPNQEQARKRAELILKVRSGLMTAKDAATELGVSRKTYYKWEQRALSAMVNALSDRRSGRPSQPVDGKKEAMKQEINGLQKALLESEQRLYARDLLLDDDPEMTELVRELLAKKKEGETGESDEGDKA